MGASSLGLGSIYTMVSLCKYPALDVMKDLPKDQVKIPEQFLCGAVGPNGRDLPQAPKARLFKSASSQASPLKQSKASKAGSLLTLLGEVFEFTLRRVLATCAGARKMWRHDCFDATWVWKSHSSHWTWQRGTGATGFARYLFCNFQNNSPSNVFSCQCVRQTLSGRCNLPKRSCSKGFLRLKRQTSRPNSKRLTLF